MNYAMGVTTSASSRLRRTGAGPDGAGPVAACDATVRGPPARPGRRRDEALCGLGPRLADQRLASGRSGRCHPLPPKSARDPSILHLPAAAAFNTARQLVKRCHV